MASLTKKTPFEFFSVSFSNTDDAPLTGRLPLDKASEKLNLLFQNKKLPFKLTQLSVAPLIGEAIKRTHNDESINDLFNHE